MDRRTKNVHSRIGRVGKLDKRLPIYTIVGDQTQSISLPKEIELIPKIMSTENGSKSNKQRKWEKGNGRRNRLPVDLLLEGWPDASICHFDKMVYLSLGKDIEKAILRFAICQILLTENSLGFLHLFRLHREKVIYCLDIRRQLYLLICEYQIVRELQTKTYQVEMNVLLKRQLFLSLNRAI